MEDRTQAELSYSQAVSRLEEILERIEKGEADIDELSSLVEEAAGLVSLCKKKLTQAEMQVKRITERLEREEDEGPREAPSIEGGAPAENGDEEVPF
jgi:exodeoxyribonuclease VII small subunit